MTEDKKELLFSYIKANVAPILVDFITSKDVKNAIVLPASISSNNLNGKQFLQQYVSGINVK